MEIAHAVGPRHPTSPPPFRNPTRVHAPPSTRPCAERLTRVGKLETHLDEEGVPVHVKHKEHHQHRVEKQAPVDLSGGSDGKSTRGRGWGGKRGKGSRPEPIATPYLVAKHRPRLVKRRVDHKQLSCGTDDGGLTKIVVMMETAPAKPNDTASTRQRRQRSPFPAPPPSTHTRGTSHTGKTKRRT